MSLLVRTCSTDRINVSRLVARTLIVIGGALWAIMVFAGNTTTGYSDATLPFRQILQGGVNALIPLAVTIAIFVLSLYYERLAAVVLFAGALGFLVWGAVMRWEPNVWVSAAAFLVLPMVISGALLLLAASTQRVCELEGTAWPAAPA